MLLPVGAGGALQDVREPLLRARRADRSGDDDGKGDGYRYSVSEILCFCCFLSQTHEKKPATGFRCRF